MKKLFLLPLFGMMLFCSCNNDEQQITQTAQGYLDAMANYRIKDAEPFATDETRNITLHSIEKFIIPNLDPSVIANATPATVKIDSIQKPCDTNATVYFTKTMPSAVESGTINLVKRNKKWQVDLVIELPSFLRMKADPQPTENIDSTKEASNISTK